jgi:hypothetical protein
MITLFHVCGCLIYCDEAGHACGYDDVHTKIEMCRKHFAEVGLDEQILQKLIR